MHHWVYDFSRLREIDDTIRSINFVLINILMHKSIIFSRSKAASEGKHTIFSLFVCLAEMTGEAGDEETSEEGVIFFFFLNARVSLLMRNINIPFR
jgi:hypothetical protein